MPLNNCKRDRGTGDEDGSGSSVVDLPGEDTNEVEEEEPLPDNSFEEDYEAYKLVEEVLARRSQPTAKSEEESQWFILDDVVEEDSEDDKEDEEDL